MLYEDTTAKVLSPNGTSGWCITRRHTSSLYFYHCLRLHHATGNWQWGIIGFKLDNNRIRQHKPAIITDFDFEDDIALVTEEINQAENFLQRVQNSAARIGLHLNTEKTEFICFNQEQEPVLNTIGKDKIKFMALSTSVHR